MIYRILVGVFCFFYITTEAQVLRELNYNYLYDPATVFSFDWKVVRLQDNFRVFYEVRQNDAVNLELSVAMETRGSTGEKSGNSIPVPAASSQSGTMNGFVDFQASQGQNVIVAKITISSQGKPKVYTYYKQLPTNKSQYLITDQQVALSSFINTKKTVTFSGFDANSIQISHYKLSFPI